MPKNKVHTIVLTGGPCAGKTSALLEIDRYFTAKGFHVLTVPEAATLLGDAGAGYHQFSGSKAAREQWHHELMALQMCLEDRIATMARHTGKPTLVVCDRGMLDPKAFVTDTHWWISVDELGMDGSTLADDERELLGRYQAVFHLVTTADGAEAHFGNATNRHRQEDTATAIKLDRKLQEVWKDHPYHRVIGNTEGGWALKADRLISGICRFLGLQPLIEKERRWLVPFSVLPELESAYKPTVHRIAQRYRGAHERIRISHLLGRPDETQHTRTIKHRTGVADERFEVERTVTPDAYHELARQGFGEALQKHRYKFDYAGLIFELDRFTDSSKAALILEVETDRPVISLPPELVDRAVEITGDDRYSNYSLAKHGLDILKHPYTPPN